jgi:predicted SprT family Zn-dependent metalloprotease
MTVEEIIQDACNRNNVSDLADQIDVLFSDRMTSTAGRAKYSRNGKHYIKLSTVFLQRAPKEKIINTIYHEVCHIITHYVYGFRASSHGWQWRAIMYACGQTPTRTHNVDMPGRNRHKRVKIDCYCPGGTKLGPTQYKRMLRGTRYRCSKCGFKINKETVT